MIRYTGFVTIEQPRDLPFQIMN